MTTRYQAIALVTTMTLMFAPVSATAFPETWVEPHLTDCDGTPQTIHPHAFGTGIVSNNTSDLDDDQRVEGSSVSSTDEDGDGDPIFETIQAALNATDAGGVVHIIAPGVYRENLTIDDSVTLRGTATGDVILEGACNETPGVGIDITGSGKTVRLENLTIQGWDIGVDIASSDVAMTNCRVRNCENGITGPASSANRLDFVRSEVRDCTEDCIFSDQANWRIEDSVIASCDYGLRLNGTGGTNIITVTRSSVFGHGVDGIIVNLSSSGSMLTLHDSSVTRNAGRGITYTAQCGVGHNQIIYNVTDNENGTIACTDAGSTSSNAAP